MTDTVLIYKLKCGHYEHRKGDASILKHLSYLYCISCRDIKDIDTVAIGATHNA